MALNNIFYKMLLFKGPPLSPKQRPHNILRMLWFDKKSIPNCIHKWHITIYTSSRKKRTNHSLVFIKIKWPLHVCSKMWLWKQKNVCVCGFHEIFHPVKSLVSIICSDFINHHRHFYEFSTTNSRIVKKNYKAGSLHFL